MGNRNFQNAVELGLPLEVGKKMLKQDFNPNEIIQKLNPDSKFFDPKYKVPDWMIFKPSKFKQKEKDLKKSNLIYQKLTPSKGEL